MNKRVIFSSLVVKSRLRPIHSNNWKAKLSTASDKIKAERYPAIRVGADGSFQEVHISKIDLLSVGKLHMRDLLQLGLDVPFQMRHINRLPPQVWKILILIFSFSKFNPILSSCREVTVLLLFWGHLRQWFSMTMRCFSPMSAGLYSQRSPDCSAS